MAHCLEGDLGTQFGKNVLAQEGNGAVRHVQKLVTDLMASNFIEMHLVEGLFSGPCPCCPEDSSNLAGEGGHGDGDD
jgi:hypothetical protein